LHHFRDKRQFQSKIATPMYLTPPLTGFPSVLGIGARGQQTGMVESTEGQNSFKIGLAV